MPNEKHFNGRCFLANMEASPLSDEEAVLRRKVERSSTMVAIGMPMNLGRIFGIHSNVETIAN